MEQVDDWGVVEIWGERGVLVHWVLALVSLQEAYCGVVVSGGREREEEGGREGG